MTKRDWAQLAAWLALAWLVYDDRAVEITALVTGVDNAKRVARLEAQVEDLKDQVVGFESELQTERQWRDSTREKVQKLELENERRSLREGSNQ